MFNSSGNSNDRGRERARLNRITYYMQNATSMNNGICNDLQAYTILKKGHHSWHCCSTRIGPHTTNTKIKWSGAHYAGCGQMGVLTYRHTGTIGDKWSRSGAQRVWQRTRVVECVIVAPTGVQQLPPPTRDGWHPMRDGGGTRREME